jgi:hypothetical protein
MSEQLPQRQDSLTDQMEEVMRLANRAGCYDAADWIGRRFFPERQKFADAYNARQA